MICPPQTKGNGEYVPDYSDAWLLWECLTRCRQITELSAAAGTRLSVVRMDLISIWCIVIPLSFVMAFVVKASPAGRGVLP